MYFLQNWFSVRLEKNIKIISNRLCSCLSISFYILFPFGVTLNIRIAPY